MNINSPEDFERVMPIFPDFQYEELFDWQWWDGAAYTASRFYWDDPLSEFLIDMSNIAKAESCGLTCEFIGDEDE